VEYEALDYYHPYHDLIDDIEDFFDDCDSDDSEEEEAPEPITDTDLGGVDINNDGEISQAAAFCEAFFEDVDGGLEEFFIGVLGVEGPDQDEIFAWGGNLDDPVVDFSDFSGYAISLLDGAGDLIDTGLELFTIESGQSLDTLADDTKLTTGWDTVTEIAEYDSGTFDGVLATDLEVQITRLSDGAVTSCNLRKLAAAEDCDYRPADDLKYWYDCTLEDFQDPSPFPLLTCNNLKKPSKKYC